MKQYLGNAEYSATSTVGTPIQHLLPLMLSLALLLTSLALLGCGITAPPAVSQTPPSGPGPGPTAGTPVSISGFYGSGIQFDALNNAQIADYDVDYRFRATASGAVTSFQWFDVYARRGDNLACDGYGCGTGGSDLICLYADDATPAHLWANEPLGCVTDSNLRSGDYLRTETFSHQPVLTAGTLYHLHWHNTDPDPARNFVSVDDAFVWNATTPRQPMISDTDLAVIGGTKEISTDTPIFEINYANGAVQGQGYMEPWTIAPADISYANRVREHITVSGSDRNVVSVSIRVNRASGPSPLTVTLAAGSGAILEQGSISASHFPEGTPVESTANTLTWGTYVFASAHTLNAGQSYDLILSTPGDTRYQAYAIQKGTLYSYQPATFFADGRGQFTMDGGATWTGFGQPGGTGNRTDADIQFFFTTQ